MPIITDLYINDSNCLIGLRGYSVMLGGVYFDIYPRVSHLEIYSSDRTISVDVDIMLIYVVDYIYKCDHPSF